MPRNPSSPRSPSTLNIPNSRGCGSPKERPAAKGSEVKARNAFAAALFCGIAFQVFPAAPAARDTAGRPTPHVVTADIQAGIERHIEEQTRLGGGYFKLAFDRKELQLKLVRVHLEYLA